MLSLLKQRLTIGELASCEKMTMKKRATQYSPMRTEAKSSLTCDRYRDCIAALYELVGDESAGSATIATAPL